jgi:hypothetical protein
VSYNKRNACYFQAFKINFFFQTEGFFVECGAADGEQVSNTLYMERYLGWGGILIEADTKFYERLMTRKRKALALHACLSLEPFPTKVIYNVFIYSKFVLILL